MEVDWFDENEVSVILLFFFKTRILRLRSDLGSDLKHGDSMQNFIFRKRCTLTIVAAYIIRDKTKKGGRVICWRRLRGCRSNLTFFLSLSLSLRKLCINLWNNSIATRVERKRPWKLLSRNYAISSHLNTHKIIFSMDSNQRLLLFDTRRFEGRSGIKKKSRNAFNAAYLVRNWRTTRKP